MAKQMFYNEKPSGKSQFFTRESRMTEFARRLQAIHIDKGWTQAELARRSGLGEDSISGYIRGRTLPRPEQLVKLCKALGVERDELLPPRSMAEVGNREKPPLEFKDLGDGRAWLSVNQAVDFAVGLKIMQLLAGAKEQ